jgi:asparagine synthase (glutamine-hydrolysing)
LKKQHYLLDGLGYRGIFDNGSDLTSRFKRIEHGHLQLNGAGDIAMLYYSWPNKPITISRMLQGKYDRGDYSMCQPEHFDKKAYFSTFKDKIGHILNTSNNKITRNQLEMLLPLLRVKYWTGMNHMINNQLSDALVPFCEPRFFHMTSDIPFKHKYLGYFKAALINLVDPIIAKYPSGYGFSFSDYTRIPAKVKLINFCRYHTPAAVRPFLRAHYWKQENKGRFPYYLSYEYQNAIFRSPELSVSEFIDIKNISDPDMLSRVLTCEVLLNDNF